MSRKKMSPLGTMIREKSFLGHDLHVGDVVVCMGSRVKYGQCGLAVLAGETQKNTRVIMISARVVQGGQQWQPGYYEHGTMHSGQMYKVLDPFLTKSPWLKAVHKHIQENS